jgi:uncharacterized damage-inducible protein DinB
MLAGWLAFHRSILLHKTNGLSDEQSRLCHPPSELTILGLVRHLAETERWWFRMIFAGEDIEPRWCDDNDRDRDFHVTSEDTLAEAVAAYREECDASDLIIARSTLDQHSAGSSPRLGGMRPSLRWVLTHMIEETARHNGHADLIRESIDGRASRLGTDRQVCTDWTCRAAMVLAVASVPYRHFGGSVGG